MFIVADLVSLTARTKMIYSKLKALELSQHYSHYKYNLRHSRVASPTVQGLICPNLEAIQAIIVDSITCKNAEDLIKNEGARVVTTLYINFKDAQWQLTP